MSTETPLNARQRAEAFWTEVLGAPEIRPHEPEWEHLAILGTRLMKHNIVSELEKRFEAHARAVLAEAERALRERAKQLDAAPITADYLLGEANGWFEAADLLAGMRR